MSDLDAGRAVALIDQLSGKHTKCEFRRSPIVGIALGGADGLAHATPTGMAAHPGLPFDIGLLRSDHWLAEIVYFPLETPLLAEAKRLGCRTVSGGGMAVFQAVGAFQLFTGVVRTGRMIRHFASLGEGGGV